MKKTICRREKPIRRRGAAMAELAVCLPLLLLLVIGTIEATGMVYLKQSLTVAAYEGSRRSIQQDATSDQVVDAIERILTQRNVQDAEINISPADFADQPRESWIQIQVSAPCEENSVFPGWFYDDQVLNARATMMKEF